MVRLRKLVFLGFAVTIPLSGCSLLKGTVPDYVYCKGKGNISVGPYAGQVDCGDGIIIQTVPPAAGSPVLSVPIPPAIQPAPVPGVPR